MQAELFEAYVAQFEREYGYPQLYRWLFQLYEPLIHRLIAQPSPTRTFNVPGGAASPPQTAVAAIEAYGRRTGQAVKVTHDIRHEGPMSVNVCVVSCGGLTASGSGRTRMMADNEQVYQLLRTCGDIRSG